MSCSDFPDEPRQEMPEPRDPMELKPFSEILPSDMDFVKENINFGGFICRSAKHISPTSEGQRFVMPYPFKKGELIQIVCPACGDHKHVEQLIRFGNQTLLLEMK